MQQRNFRDERSKRIERRRKFRVARNLALGILIVVAGFTLWQQNAGFDLQSSSKASAAHVPTQSQSSVPVERATEEASQWRIEVGRLDACRLRLLAARDERALSDCYAPASPAWIADEKAFNLLIAQGIEFSALPIEVKSVSLIDRRWSSSAEYVRLAVRDELRSNAAEVAGKKVSLPPRAERAWEVTLVRASSSAMWQWYEVKPAPQRTPAPESGAAK